MAGLVLARLSARLARALGLRDVPDGRTRRPAVGEGCASALCARKLGTDCWCGWMDRGGQQHDMATVERHLTLRHHRQGEAHVRAINEW